MRTEAEGAGRSIVIAPEKKSRVDLQSVTGPIYFISPLMLLVVWEIVGDLRWIDVRFFPPPSLVAGTFWAELVNGDWFVHVGATLGRVAFGFGAGATIGILLGAF